jgi:copper chaperone
MTETKIRIGGMSCMHCVGRVEKALTSLEGVKSAKVSLEKNEAVVEYDPGKTDRNKFKGAVEEVGYKVVD